MGSSNPISKAIAFSPAAYLFNEASGNASARRRAETDAKGARNELSQNKDRAAADILTANQSVEEQKTKQRKQTVFAGGGSANLFNKSLIGTSTTAAGSNQMSLLGA